MNHYRVTVDGKTFEVTLEDLDGVPSVSAVHPVAATPQAVSSSPQAAKPQPTKPVSKPTATPTGNASDITAPMPGAVLSVAVKEGQQVKKGQILLVFEAMKMENEIVAPRDATIAKIHVSKGAAIDTGTLLVTLT